MQPGPSGSGSSPGSHAHANAFPVAVQTERPVAVQGLGSHGLAQRIRWHWPSLQVSLAAHALESLHVRMTQKPMVVAQRPWTQSSCDVQGSAQAPLVVHSVVPGQSPSPPQPMQTPPAGSGLQVLTPGQSASVTH